jgi:hypothetical protein
LVLTFAFLGISETGWGQTQTYTTLGSINVQAGVATKSVDLYGFVLQTNDIFVFNKESIIIKSTGCYKFYKSGF